MGALLFMLSAILIWFGIDALLLSLHGSPPAQIEKDELMFGEGHRRPVSDDQRSFAERRYPFATAFSMRLYGCLFIVAGAIAGWVAWVS